MLHSLLNVPGDADARRRGRTVIVIVLVQFALLATALPIVLASPRPLPALITIGFSLAIFAGVLALARSGRVGAAALALVGTALAGVLVAVLATPGVTEAIFYLTLPVLVAGIVLRPWQVWPTVALALAIVLVELNVEREAVAASEAARSALTSAGLLALFGGVLNFCGARIMRRAFWEAAEAQAVSAQAASALATLNAGLEAQIAARTDELRGALASAEARAAEKQSLLDELAAQQAVIREMSVPVLPISTKTLVMPLVGALDSGRLQLVQSQALEALERTRALRLVLDVTGVPIVDSQVAQGIVTVVQAARLLGTETVLVGIRPEVAQALVGLGVNLHDIGTASDLHSAIRQEVRGT